MSPKSALIAVTLVLAVAWCTGCGTAPRRHYSFPSKGGAQRGLPALAEQRDDGQKPAATPLEQERKPVH